MSDKKITQLVEYRDYLAWKAEGNVPDIEVDRSNI